MVKLPDKPETVRPLEQRPVPVVFQPQLKHPQRSIQQYDHAAFLERVHRWKVRAPPPVATT